MPINIPTIINELGENTTEEQRKGLSILENRFYECIELKKENVELVTKCHILNEANMNLENTVGELGEQLKEANEVIKNMKLCMDDKYDYDCVAEGVDVYLEKWGVK